MTIEEAIHVLTEKRADLQKWIDCTLNPEGTYPDICTYAKALDVALSALRAQQEAEKNGPLTLEDLKQMDGQAVWLNNSPHDWRCFIVNNEYVFHGAIAPCGIDMRGQATSLSLLAEIGLYRRPPESVSYLSLP